MRTMMKKYCIAIPLAVFCCFGSAHAETERVKVAQFGKEKFLLYLPLYIAMEEGYFLKNGIELDLLFAGNDDQVFATVAGGSADFGVGDPVFSAIAQEKGFPAKTVAMLVKKLGNTGYTNNKGIKEIASPKDLAGLRLGSLPKPSTTYTLLEKIRSQHIDALRETTIVQAGIGAQLALLEAGKVDIAVDLEPSVSRLEEQGYRVVFHLNEYIEPQVITGLTTRSEVIQQRPEIVTGMVRAIEKGLQTIHEDKETAISVARRLFPDLSEKVTRRAVERMIAKDVFPKSAHIPDEYWQRTLQTRLEIGQLKKPQATSKSVDNQFTEKARSRAKLGASAN